MYTRNKNTSQRRSGGGGFKDRPNTQSSSTPRRSFGRPQHKRGFGARKNTSIHFSKFISKAKPVVQEAVYAPKHIFADFPITQALKANIAKKGYVQPSAIQDQAIPEILKGRDLIGLANTGTGKTAAFLIPLIDKISRNRNEMVLIMTPTRELALQIHKEIRDFTDGMKMFSVCCVGGAPIGRQIRELRYRNNFIVGTPGRLKDLLESKHLDLSSTKNVVLDEADRMLDMGFIDDIRAILKRVPSERQTLFFSATTTKEIEGLVHQFLKNPVTISVRTGETAEYVDQDVVHIGKDTTKIDVLSTLLQKDDFKKTLVFGKTKHGVEKLQKELFARGIKVESIHGDKRQSKREQALRLFKENKVQVLVATDVAARGIDVVDISHVINFDVPATYEDYIHRIGRTGRGGKSGKALTFIDHR